MIWTPYALLHLTAAVVSALTASLVWRRRQAPAARAMLYLAVASCYWSATNALELLSPTLDGKTFWVGLEYPGIVSVSVLWFLFAMRYTGRDLWLTRRKLGLLVVIPAVTVVLVATNSRHGLMRYDISLDTSGPFAVISKSYGPWFYVAALYSHTLALVGTAVLAESLVRSHYIYRMQGVSLVVAVLLPLAANLAYIFGHSPVPGMDLTASAFAISGLIVVLSILRFQTLDLVPAARSQVVDGIGDGVLVLDEQGRIVDLNPAGARLLRLPAASVVGRSGADVTAQQPALSERLRCLAESRSEVTINAADGEAHFDVMISALRRHSRISGWVVVLRDVTARRRAEAEREVLIGELQEALKRIRTLRGLIPICASCKKVRDDQGYWQQVEEYVRAHSEASFTHAICPDCMRRLYPEMNENE